MRLRIDIQPVSKDRVEIPKAYRNNLLSLFKHLFNLGNEKFFNDYYGNKLENKMKPFTFTTYLPDIYNKEGSRNITLSKGYFSIFVSTNDFNFLGVLITGLNSLKGFTPFSFPIKLLNYSFLPERVDFDSVVTYKTLSPIVVTKYENRKSKGYYKFNEKGFIEGLKESIKVANSKVYSINEKAFDDIIIETSGMKNVYIHFKEHIINCNSGYIRVTANPIIQKFIYDIGVGSRRSQGFGMLEVI